LLSHVARRIHSRVGARGIYARRARRRHPREERKNGVGGADSHRRNTSLSVTRQRRRVDDGQTRTHPAHGRRPADTRDFLHAGHSTFLRMLCAPGPGGDGQKRSLQGKKGPSKISHPPLPPPPLRCKVLTVCGPAGGGGVLDLGPAKGGGQRGGWSGAGGRGVLLTLGVPNGHRL
jgi:hypothetical protein